MSSRDAAIVQNLLGWYDDNKRDLPWRRTRDPYAIWVSEVMLQQTQVATVKGYYARWMERFPTIASLAQADEHDVLAQWQGLGYYRRARTLRAGACAVLERHAGTLPSSVDELLALPGIGAYSAGAIGSIAFGLRTPLVDGNVVRVLCRLDAERGDPTRGPLKKRLWRRADELVPEARPGDFNQALMELGATVCTPKAPRCGQCPLRPACRARASGLEAELPELPERPKPTSVHMVAAVVARKGRVLVTRLPENAPRWSGMWQFPTTEVSPGESAEQAAARVVKSTTGLSAEVRGKLGVVRHGVTRYKITLDSYRCEARSGRAVAKDCAEVAWKAPSELDQLALPAAQRRIANQLRVQEDP